MISHYIGNICLDMNDIDMTKLPHDLILQRYRHMAI